MRSRNFCELFLSADNFEIKCKIFIYRKIKLLIGFSLKIIRKIVKFKNFRRQMSLFPVLGAPERQICSFQRHISGIGPGKFPKFRR